MVCHRNQFGYRLFFLPLPADIFSSVFHSLNSIKKSACCYFKLLYLSFEQFIFKHWAAYPKFNPGAIWQDLNLKYTTVTFSFSSHSVIMARGPTYLIFKAMDCYNSSPPKLMRRETACCICKYFIEGKYQLHHLLIFILQLLLAYFVNISISCYTFQFLCNMQDFVRYVKIVRSFEEFGWTGTIPILLTLQGTIMLKLFINLLA